MFYILIYSWIIRAVTYAQLFVLSCGYPMAGPTYAQDMGNVLRFIASPRNHLLQRIWWSSYWPPRDPLIHTLKRVSLCWKLNATSGTHLLLRCAQSTYLCHHSASPPDLGFPGYIPQSFGQDFSWIPGSLTKLVPDPQLSSIWAFFSFQILFKNPLD